MIKNLPPFFSSVFESVFALHLPGKILNFDCFQRLFTLSKFFVFHGPPLHTFKTDRLDLRGKTLNNNDHNQVF